MKISMFKEEKMQEKNINNEFEVFNDLGERIKCNALFTFESDETGKNYIVYTDNTIDDYGNKKVYAYNFDPKEENPILGSIETDEEWKVIENILNKLQEKREEK